MDLIERVNLAVGIPASPDQKMVPVTIFDLESRRVKYQHAPRDQLAVMGGRKTAQWTAIWSSLGQEWKLLDIVSETAEAA